MIYILNKLIRKPKNYLFYLKKYFFKNKLKQTDILFLEYTTLFM